jgi:hypothetical protein
MTIARRPVFFTSIPKCGKNLVYSFFFELGLKRWAWGDAPSTLHAAHFARVSDKPNYAFPELGPISDVRERAALEDVCTQLTSLPPNAIAHHHFLPAPGLLKHIADAGVSAIFIKRDPRDALLSMLNFSRKRQLPSHVSALIEPLSDEEALLLLLDGGDQLVPFATYFDAYHGWLAARGVATFRFEDIVGTRGGGDGDKQDEMCRRLATLAGFAEDDPIVKEARQRMFNVQAGTFFKGQIGAWREAFTPTVRRAYDRNAAWLGERWGYEGPAVDD